MSGPTPQTDFEAWGQALIGITNSDKITVTENRDLRRGLLALVMIADRQKQWAAWYYFSSNSEKDIQLFGDFASEVLAESPKSPSFFTTRKAMTVDQLCGNDTTLLWRRALLMGPPRDIGEDNFELRLVVQSRPDQGPTHSIAGEDLPTTQPIHLRFKRRDGTSDITTYPIGFGWLTYTGIYESYNFLWPYHSKHQKLRAMEKMLLAPERPKFRLGM
jgi:hypothetical protein